MSKYASIVLKPINHYGNFVTSATTPISALDTSVLNMTVSTITAVIKCLEVPDLTK
jgi:hypothetical protein